MTIHQVTILGVIQCDPPPPPCNIEILAMHMSLCLWAWYLLLHKLQEEQLQASRTEINSGFICGTIIRNYWLINHKKNNVSFVFDAWDCSRERMNCFPHNILRSGEFAYFPFSLVGYEVANYDVPVKSL